MLQLPVGRGGCLSRMGSRRCRRGTFLSCAYAQAAVPSPSRPCTTQRRPNLDLRRLCRSDLKCIRRSRGGRAHVTCGDGNARYICALFCTATGIRRWRARSVEQHQQQQRILVACVIQQTVSATMVGHTLRRPASIAKIEAKRPSCLAKAWGSQFGHWGLEPGGLRIVLNSKRARPRAQQIGRGTCA